MCADTELAKLHNPNALREKNIENNNLLGFMF